MFRRRHRFRSRRNRGTVNSVTHVPSSMNNIIQPADTLVFFASVPANYPVTGTPVTNDTFEQADRANLTPIGARITRITFDVSIQDITDQGTIEWAIFKIERAPTVPALGNQLPLSAEISVQGLQQAMRQYQPGRVIKFGQLSVASEQPRSFRAIGRFGRFRMQANRTGDYYGIIIFNKTGGTPIISVQARYKAYT